MRASKRMAMLVLALAAQPVLAGEPASLARLRAERTEIAAALAAQAARCVRRTDTGHAAFKGCIDWHSAVHGTWALLAYERASGDGRYRALVDRVLDPAAIAAERRFLAARPQFELPYGRAWFLRLALEDRAVTGDARLESFADEVAASLIGFFERNGVDALSGSYDSHSWALINLFDHARARGDKALERRIEAWAVPAFVEAGLACPWNRERGNFMAVCTNRAALVARVLPQAEYETWLERFIAANGLPEPVFRPLNAHHLGLNFSRAWGLVDMYRASGRLDVAEAYAAHLRAGLEPASNWAGDYHSVGHWVAQFGMFAIQPLFGGRAGE